MEYELVSFLMQISMCNNVKITSMESPEVVLTDAEISGMHSPLPIVSNAFWLVDECTLK